MTDALQSFLDAGTSFEGKISFSGVVRIDGDFQGEASADGTLVIGETGTAEATLRVQSLIVLGRLVGEVNAKDRVQVGPNGRIEGRVKTPRLVVEEGGELEASLDMGGA